MKTILLEETQCRLRAAAVIEPVSATVLNKFNEVLFIVSVTQSEGFRHFY